MTRRFHRVLESDCFTENEAKHFLVNGWPVVVCRSKDVLHAFINRCSHAASALAPDGRVRRGAIMCPLHGARFDVSSGQCLGGGNYLPLMTFEVRIAENGGVEVAVPDEPPGHEHLPVKPLT